MNKKIVLITQSKGGSGKSVLCYLLAEKYPDALIVDMDQSTKTTSRQLAYRKPILQSLLSDKNNIDREKLAYFLESLSQSKDELIFCDLGAAISEQLPYFIQDTQDDLTELMEELQIDLYLYCVVTGGDMFSASMEYLSALNQSLIPPGTAKKKPPRLLSLTAMVNDFRPMKDAQQQQFTHFMTQEGISHYTYNLLEVESEFARERVEKVLASGQGIQNQAVFSKRYFRKAIKKLAV
ncbi:MAG: hypothetical protein RIG62_17930 [Cyclobacteriaceae bacterium]